MVTSGMRSRWKRVRYWLEWAGLVLATKVIPLLPRRFCLHFAQVFGWLMSILDRRSFRVALSNIEAAFGNQFSESERRKIARDSFEHFAQAAMDLLWSPRLTRDNVSRFVELENFEEIARSTGPEQKRTNRMLSL